MKIQVWQILVIHGHWVTKPRHVDFVAWVVLQLLHYFAQDGYQWEGIMVPILPRQVSVYTAYARGSGTSGTN